jgi:hypothetical protein
VRAYLASGGNPSDGSGRLVGNSAAIQKRVSGKSTSSQARARPIKPSVVRQAGDAADDHVRVFSDHPHSVPRYDTFTKGTAECTRAAQDRRKQRPRKNLPNQCSLFPTWPIIRPASCALRRKCCCLMPGFFDWAGRAVSSPMYVFLLRRLAGIAGKSSLLRPRDRGIGHN